MCIKFMVAFAVFFVLFLRCIVRIIFSCNAIFFEPFDNMTSYHYCDKDECAQLVKHNKQMNV